MIFQVHIKDLHVSVNVNGVDGVYRGSKLEFAREDAVHPHGEAVRVSSNGDVEFPTRSELKTGRSFFRVPVSVRPGVADEEVVSVGGIWKLTWGG